MLIGGGITLTALIGSSLSTAAEFNGEQAPSAQQIQSAIEAARLSSAKASKTSRKLDPMLAQLLNTQHKGADDLNSHHPLIRTKGSGLVQVYISLNTTSESSLENLRNNGVDIEVINADLNKVQAWVPKESFKLILQMSTVKRIDRPHYATPQAGRVVTQGDAILRADKLRELGVTGEGIRVGIVSDGANSWRSAAASGDLPSAITTYGSCTTRSANPAQCSPRLTCNEGTAMAEIIHDLAPDAEIAVAAVSTSMEFISQINRLASTFEADIIVDDLGFFGEPYFTDGELARAVSALPSNILYVSSAGNSAATHYERDYRKFPANTNIHDFGTQEGAGADDALGFLIRPNSGTVALLQWNESFANPGSNYDLYIFDSDGNITQQSAFPSGPAFEAACIPNTSSSDQVRFAVVDKRSGAGRRLEMFFLGAGAIEYPIASGSIFGHAGVERALAVATTNAGSNAIAFYSSRGPAQRNRAKPDLTAVDGVDVTGAGGFPSRFFGTSAAAPHVAGVAALLLSASTKNTPELVRAAMLRTATDFGASGRDSTFGFGRVNAEAAIGQLDIDSDFAAIGGLLLLLLEDEE